MGNPKQEIRFFPDAVALTKANADFVLHHTSLAIETYGTASLALAGGSTPKALYALLATPPFREQIDWTKVHVFWGDERHVPPDHPDSNFGMAYGAMLSKIPIPTSHIHRMEGERQKAEDAAVAYETLLSEHFKVQPPHVPRFDVVLLGLGPDGHTASLFPETSAIQEPTHWVTAPWVEKFHTYRITMTPVLLNHASNIAFLVSGADKSGALQAVLEGPFQPDKLPAQVIQPVQGTVTWFLDQQASATLTLKP